MTDNTLQGYLSQFGEVEAKPLSRFQQVVARRLSQSWTEVPHVTHNDDIDVTTLEEHRAALAEAGMKVTPLAFVAKALAIAFDDFPQFNASLGEDKKTLLLKSCRNVGIAVDTPAGLLVPVLRDVAARTVADLADEIRNLSVQARDKGLPMDMMEGGSMTISSLGGIGGTGFTPIVNQPEVAILGITQTVVKPVWDGAAFLPRKMMPVSLSYDHRVINGADAARFVRRLSQILERPQDI
ncbi:2-oxo acid dehydrogenase subunit E2 [Sphingopyxis flava]|uniref:Dihydrolipoyllysine-residue acetyltransferase component of pyruvate dehydrogenase complex n=1 Tax=Sphingopyxis flava TaxID=1507287 RepID=A0A1T5FWD6_9SPHN|nr:2-oxo acid dehydrogenase subunit E2 [Sphingopyxis flava]SKC00374.1 2-oxoacid dehydrogenases acyltransferase (catalytic domain) [Sphingopyxis flava]